MTFDSSILTHVFRYDHFYPLDELFFYSSLHAHPACTNIFIIRVDRLRTGAWGLFFGNTVYGDWKKSFGALLALSLAVH